MTAIVWFRDDLRIDDNPALAAASSAARPTAALYVLETAACGPRVLGAAARWKLHGALVALRADLATLNIPLILHAGDARNLLPSVAAALKAGRVFWNRRYEPSAVACDTHIKDALTGAGLKPASFNGALLVEPWDVATGSGGFYKMFTPFCKAARASGCDLRPRPAPGPFPEWQTPPNLGDRLDDWGLRPTKPNWAAQMEGVWPHGGRAAGAALTDFLGGGFQGYAVGRDFPASAHCSRLSPHLRFGEISARRARAVVLRTAEATAVGRDNDFESFERELYWRDFAYNLLFYANTLESHNFQEKFDNFPWRQDTADLKAWQDGQTGYPIIDAGMRQLWQTGWMHNRVRMAAASFLTKHLMIDWRVGENWFWDTLVDADVASNPSNWQWVAGSGADAAPFFRIFNPISQGQKFDGDGAYVRRWVPEIAALPNKYLHAPWTAPANVLHDASVKLGGTYPAPIVDHKTARLRALAAFKSLSAQP